MCGKLKSTDRSWDGQGAVDAPRTNEHHTASEIFNSLPLTLHM